jgi:hypothetical protein
MIPDLSIRGQVMHLGLLQKFLRFLDTLFGFSKLLFGFGGATLDFGRASVAPAVVWKKEVILVCVRFFSRGAGACKVVSDYSGTDFGSFSGLIAMSALTNRSLRLGGLL